jgi:hypothetical protein
MRSEAEPLIQTEETSEVPLHPGIFRETKIGSDRSIETCSQYFWGVDLLLNQSFPVLEVAWKRLGRQLP